jgi:predicted house-cleaning noncanonical NTP pyrophosphatase (MazG superfamily)
VKSYNKLIRDKIPLIMTKEGKDFTTHIASDEEYRKKLKEKLLEEVNEFLEDPCLEELADIAEVFGALVPALGYTLDQLETVVRKKKKTKGAFRRKIILETVGK